MLLSYKAAPGKEADRDETMSLVAQRQRVP